MKGKTFFFITLLAIIAATMCVATAPRAAIFAALAVAFVAAILFYRSVRRTLHTIRVGMDLLRSQDFASRLTHVGQKDADSMVDLYNTIIGHLKEERLRNFEQESFLSKIIEASPTGIAVCDFNGRIVRTNKSFRNFESPVLMESLDGLPEDGVCIIRPGGMQVLRCSRLFFMDRGFHRTFYLVERLTDEIVKAETAMFHKIVRTIGHEVNNTLGGVNSVLQTLGALHQCEPEVADAVTSCCNSCDNLGNFVRAYSEIVKLPDAVLESVDLNKFVLDSLPFLRGICPQGVTLTTALSSAPVTVNADTMLLQRVLLNAVRNSCESIASSCDSEGTITIVTAPGEMQVVDNGPGIAPENAARIFSPFFSTKRADRGLGLMLIADILRKHRATFTLATVDRLTRLSIQFTRQ